MNLITIVLRSSEEPVLSRVQMHRLARAHKAHLIYLKHKTSLADSDDDEGPQDEDAWLLEDLKILIQLYSRLRDREKLIELVFEVRFRRIILGRPYLTSSLARDLLLNCSRISSLFFMHHWLRCIGLQASQILLAICKIL